MSHQHVIGREPLVADIASTRPARIAMPRWVDARLLLGVLMVLVAVVVGAKVFASAGTYTRVYVARHALVPGEHVTAADLGIGKVRLDGQAALYIGVGASPPIGYVVSRYVGANEFVPVAALTASAQPAGRYVTVPVQPGHLPPGLQHGDMVDVYVTPKAAPGADAATPQLVLSSVAVQTRDGGSRSFSGSSTLAVVLAVPADKVAELIRAVESGTIDLVGVPAAVAGGS
jgi:hypothetical protein